jgi:hypothetical protein
VFPLSEVQFQFHISGGGAAVSGVLESVPSGAGTAGREMGALPAKELQIRMPDQHFLNLACRN